MTSHKANATINLKPQHYSRRRAKPDIVKKCICKLTLIIAVLFIMPLNVAQADTEANILQVYITEQTMTVFTDSELHSNELKCAISNQKVEITATGSLSDENSLTKTTVLIDISTSMPNAIRDGVITTLKKLIDRKPANEEFKLVVFGDELNILHDFSSDRYDLASLIEKIKFDGNQSKIYDAIYNTMPGIAPSDKNPTFYRTIVITDGVDDTVSGITKEELFIRLQNERYPIDVIAVSSKEITENKELSAIVRMSGGRYYSLNPNTDVTALAQTLGVSDYSYFEAIVPATLLDGTTRQVDIGDGMYNMSIDVKFPVYNSPSDAAPTPIELNEEAANMEVPKPSSTPGSTTPPLLVETVAPKAFTTIFGDYTTVIFIGVGIALILIAAVIIAVVAVRRKKKNTVSHQGSGVVLGYSGDTRPDKTEFVSDASYPETQCTIKLSSSNDPSKTWTLPVEGDLLIGRAEHCSVRLDEKSVSREHCKIAILGAGLVVVHLGTTNKTSLNGSNVVGSSPLQSGDIIKLGREVLRVDYIQTLGSPPQNPEQPRNSNSGKTESIF